MNYVNNLLAAWDQVPESTRQLGRAWYPEAHKLAVKFGHGDARMGAGLIAALSPQKAWDINVKLAERASNGDFSGHVTDALNKARRIMAGEHPAVVLPRNKKTWFFFHNVWLPDDLAGVTVDRHAYRVATFDWDNGSPVIRDRMYAGIMRSYIHAAYRAGEIPCDFQAGLWEHFRMHSYITW
jgi:hypothetical protein